MPSECLHSAIRQELDQSSWIVKKLPKSLVGPGLTAAGEACALVAAGCLSAYPLASPAAEPSPGAVILQDLRHFRELGSVLYVAAHPDDENTQLITYLARGRGYRTAYLSVTRGDGGQNVLGPEFGDELGVIRTQELLAARRLDGGRQFFTRAIDFGFSKSASETLQIWDRQQVVSDIVRVIREFRPDVIITRFSPIPGGTHGHHTSSAILAVEAFKLAGDPTAFPDQLKTLAVWQPKRILQNGRGNFGRGPDTSTNAPGLQVDIGGTDGLTGESFGDIAGRSRSMHKTQGFGNFAGFGGGRGARAETFSLLAGEPASNDILDGVDTTWARVPGGAEVGHLADETIAQFDPQAPEASVPALLKLRRLLTALPEDPVVDEKRRQFDGILQACLGLSVQTTLPDAEVVPGETLKLHHTAVVHSSVPVRWQNVRYPSLRQEITPALDLVAHQEASRDATQTLPANTPLTGPYWLREDHTTGMFRVDDPSLIGRPESPPTVPVEFVFAVDGQTLVVLDQPVQITGDAAKPESRRRLDVIPPVTLKFASETRLFAPGAARPVEIEVTAFRAGSSGTLQIETPAGWKATPAGQPFHLAAIGDHARFTFTVSAPAQPATAMLAANVQIGSARFGNERIEIRYPHIPVQLLQPPARLKAISLDLATRGHQLGYVPGAGDNVAESLEEMGYQVARLTGPDLSPERLKGLDAVIFGVRAFNVRADLGPRMAALFSYVEGGGNVIVQYNRPDGIKADRIAPFPLRLSPERVTDENARVTFLAPDHPALTSPNKITPADFDGWVQERGLYFPNQWDDHFTPIIACSDPGEAPLKGGLLVAQSGHGYFVYTGLAWFRQLPAGVPGAYRLFANLVSLGKSAADPVQGAQ